MDDKLKQRQNGKRDENSQALDYWETLATVPFSGNESRADEDEDEVGIGDEDGDEAGIESEAGVEAGIEGEDEAEAEAGIEDGLMREWRPGVGHKVMVYADGMANSRHGVEDYLTERNTLNYGRDRSYENQRMLERENGFLGQVYGNLMEEYPELRNIKLLDFDEMSDENYRDNAFHVSLWHDKAEKFVEAVYFNFAEPENYLRPENLRRGDTFGMDDTLKQLALKLGLEPSDVMRNERLVSTFVFAHEMGHAHDFHHNAMRTGVQPGELDLGDLARAVNESTEARRRHEMAWPLPGHLEADADWKIQRFRKRLIAMGIDPDNRREINQATSRAYRRMPDEAYADNFATEYILRHYDDYFETGNARGHNSGRIRPRFGELIEMSGDAELLDLRAGAQIKVTEVETDWGGWPRMRNNQPMLKRKSETYDFFLAEGIEMGEPLSVLTGFPDPAHNKPAHTVFDVEGIYTIPRRTEAGEVENQIVIRTLNRRGKYSCYQIEVANYEPVKIVTSPEKMMMRLGLREGSKVQLMKLKLVGDSKVGEASVLSGELYRPDYWFWNDPSPIQYGHGIHVRPTTYGEFGDRERYDSKDPYYFPGGSTSGVKEVYRRWNTYYVDTVTSTYEVIPFED